MPGYVPLTERFVGLVGSRGIAFLALGSLPFVHLVVVLAIRLGSGQGGATGEELTELLASRLLNVYLIVLSVWGAARVAGRLNAVLRLPGGSEPARRSHLRGVLPPIALAVLFAGLNEIQRAAEPSAVSGSAAVVGASVRATVATLVYLPTMTAFWTCAIALWETAQLDRTDGLGTFPEDRSLGLRPVGELVFQIFVLLVAAIGPVLVMTTRIIDLVASASLVAAGLGAMVLATWRLHRRMVLARTEAITVARARYAAAYRTAAQSSTGADAGPALSMAEALLRGAESIQEWPFDDRMQRIAAVVITGVITGLIVRLILLALGV